MLDLQEQSHRRFNPLTGEWILVSPHRTKRPWQGQVDEVPSDQLPRYDPSCYLCPGNERAGGHRNPPYSDTFAFDNDFASLLPDTPAGINEQDHLLMAQAERGICRVLCFSPRHDLTLARMDQGGIRRVVDAWAEQYLDLAVRAQFQSVVIFENRGAMMGASNPHPHCQVWATESLPNELAKEDASQRAYLDRAGSCLLCDYLRLERASGERVVCQNEFFAALVPFWALWPFETLIVSTRHTGSIDQLDGAERDALAGILKRLVTRYDNLFQAPFPYSMGFHQTPADGAAHPHWHFHAHFYPPLLRSAAVRKFMVGFEMLGTPQRDITAESAAGRLRALGERHYLDPGGREDE